MRITVNPGHGPKNNGTIDPGAIGLNGLHEADQNTEVAKLVIAKLKYNGHTLQQVHDGDLADVVKATDNFFSDYFISIHTNSHANRTATGVEAWALAPGGQGEKMAIAISEDLAAATGLTNRGAKFGGLHVLKCKAPAVLVEAGFISHPETEKRMRDIVFDEIVAEAICKGFSRALGLRYVSNRPASQNVAVWYFGENDKVGAEYVARKVGAKASPRSQFVKGQYNTNINVGGPEEEGHINLTGSNWIETTKEVISFLESTKPLEEWIKI